MGVPFDEETSDGRKCETTVTMEGDDKIITNQIAQKSGEKDTKIIREFTDEGIKVQMICEDVTSVQFFTRVWGNQIFNVKNHLNLYDCLFFYRYQFKIMFFCYSCFFEKLNFWYIFLSKMIPKIDDPYKNIKKKTFEQKFTPQNSTTSDAQNKLIQFLRKIVEIVRQIYY